MVSSRERKAAWEQTGGYLGEGLQSRTVFADAVPALRVKDHLSYVAGGILKKCVNSQAVYPLSEQDGLEAQERRYTAHEEGKH